MEFWVYFSLWGNFAILGGRTQDTHAINLLGNSILRDYIQSSHPGEPHTILFPSAGDVRCSPEVIPIKIPTAVRAQRINPCQGKLCQPLHHDKIFSTGVGLALRDQSPLWDQSPLTPTLTVTRVAVECYVLARNVFPLTLSESLPSLPTAASCLNLI